MGRIDIDLDDISTDKVHYPVSDIQVEKEGKSVIFSFRKPLVLRISERFSPEHFFYLWNGGNQLLPVKNGIVGKPPW